MRKRTLPLGRCREVKTALLEATARAWAPRHRIAAVSGDPATDRDAERLARVGIAARSIRTGSTCHLDARRVHRALHEPEWQDAEWFFVENVGNLVCPAIYDLGQAANVVALSVTVGEDDPLKYPVVFEKADLVVLTKIDLVPHIAVDLDAIEVAVARAMPIPRILWVSARTGQGLDVWLAWLAGLRAVRRRAPALGSPVAVPA